MYNHEMISKIFDSYHSPFVPETKSTGLAGLSGTLLGHFCVAFICWVSMFPPHPQKYVWMYVFILLTRHLCTVVCLCTSVRICHLDFHVMSLHSPFFNLLICLLYFCPLHQRHLCDRKWRRLEMVNLFSVFIETKLMFITNADFQVFKFQVFIVNNCKLKSECLLGSKFFLARKLCWMGLFVWHIYPAVWSQ